MWNAFFSVEISILVDPKQISVVSNIEQKKKDLSVQIVKCKTG